MIIKRIDAGQIASKQQYVTRLTKYLLQPHKTHHNERVLFTGHHGFVSEDISGARAELTAMADGAKTGANPVMHIVMSWQEGEQPSHSDVESAVTILLEELQLSEHGVLYAMHLDTDNLHCHIVICRVHPLTEKIVSANRGFDIEALHRSIARIEATQGWEPEPNGRYEMLSDGAVIRRSQSSAAEKHLPARRADMEHRTGERSSQRLAIEIAAPVISGASSWEQLHLELARLGMHYEVKGSGAVMWVGGVAVKASSVHRGASLTRLQKKLGKFVPAPEHIVNQRRFLQGANLIPRPLQPQAPGWSRYIRLRNQHRRQKSAAYAELKEQCIAERRALVDAHRAQRASALNHNWKHRGAARAALRSTMAAEHAGEKAALQEQIKQRRAALRIRFPAFPDFERWLLEQEMPQDAQAWRYRLSTWCILRGVDADSEEEAEPATPRDIRAYAVTVVGRTVHYSKMEAPGALPKTSFIDAGSYIAVCDASDDDALLAAMQLASQKWGGKFLVEGSDQFRMRCAAIAARHHIRLIESDLQEVAVHERKRRHVSPSTPIPTSAFDAWAEYFFGMQAPGYQLSICSVTKEGRGTATRIGTGALTRSATKIEELVQAHHEIQRLRARGTECVLKIAPVFDDKIAVRITSLSAEKLHALQKTGLQGRVVLEVAPGKFDMVLTVPWSQLKHADAAAKRWMHRMQLMHGVDMDLCSQKTLGQPMPGLNPSRDSKHTVQVYAAQPSDCESATRQIQEIDAAIQLETLGDNSKSVSNFQDHGSTEHSGDLGGVAMEYVAHHAELHRTSQPPMHPSRLDAQVCLRLKLAGHNRESIEGALVQCLRQRPGNAVEADMEQYARRATSFAWSVAAERQVQRDATLLEACTARSEQPQRDGQRRPPHQ